MSGPRSWRTDPFFFFSWVTKFAIGMFTYVAHFDRKVRIYVATKLFQFASRKEPPAILAGPDGFLRPCSRHRVQSSYGDFLNSFAMKARAGPYGSYDNFAFCAFKIDQWTYFTLFRSIKKSQRLCSIPQNFLLEERHS